MFDKEEWGTITAEDTLQIIFVRYGRGQLDDEIKELFGDEKYEDGVEKHLCYTEYIEKVELRALKENKEAIQNRTKKYNEMVPEDI